MYENVFFINNTLFFTISGNNKIHQTKNKYFLRSQLFTSVLISQPIVVSLEQECQIWDQSGSGSPQIGEIGEFIRFYFSIFCLKLKCMKIRFKNLTNLGPI